MARLSSVQSVSKRQKEAYVGVEGVRDWGIQNCCLQGEAWGRQELEVWARACTCEGKKKRQVSHTTDIPAAHRAQGAPTAQEQPTSPSYSCGFTHLTTSLAQAPASSSSVDEDF